MRLEGWLEALNRNAGAEQSWFETAQGRLLTMRPWNNTPLSG
jgi:hypothetical protein